ncbi:Pyridoxal 5'-phosphate synthase subunit snz1 [Coemansia sp. BCRC 34962]|nr:Pyridoxal 5'-phosphate synthase subunit snz1 [Coemansia sp. BCRC 34962]
MPSKAEKEREARALARKKEAEKKDKERKEKEAKIKKRLESHQAVTIKARVDMIKHGVIVEVLNTVQAKLAQEAGFNAICPYDYPQAVINKMGNPLTSDPRVVRDMINSVVIPVMAKVRVGHIIEAQMAEHLGANIIDESNYTTKLMTKHMSKRGFKVPFICAVETLEDCFRRIEEGATMLRNREPYGKSFAHTITAIRTIYNSLRALKISDAELATVAKADAAAAAATADDANKTIALSSDVIAAKATIRAKEEFLQKFTNLDTQEMIKKAINKGELPVPFYGYGSICTPNDVAMLRKMGCGAIISNIAFRADNPRRRLKKLVEASTCYNNAGKMAELSIGTNEQPIVATVRPMF